ncbi:NarK family nitrate/nitrite MFS transporter [Parasegetibacter sp. NRK P23]|uniref:NarK family nitrate/nitrite MFS transporter n=1 Tax=Parasegetibacter sp. NRK P23 TaxID=2942999 RepID=UPI00204482CB|nr:NarK family nitrate/nitrite MFS transporter [Parasegetibacter sp. NRK P23]MCM5526938.1 NarK family nitrate/nitrite MFS transporter [Parasegetibacter sp. NRK P23]
MTNNQQPLSSLNVFSFKGVQMRTFHITWMTFFVCFFGWFGLAPLMPTIKEDLQLTKSQIGNVVIASVSATIIARLLIGRLCDTWGPRKTYTALLLIGSIPVFCVGLAQDYTSFLLFRLAIGVIGASFVITQFHTSMMFAPQIKGTANAVAGGWGNLGGGITNMVMPLVFALIVGFGYTNKEAWRYAMILPGSLMLVMAFLYYRFTKDTPAGNYEDIERVKAEKKKTDYSILKDWRIWSLALAYAVCFGMEITFDNVAALHFVQEFKLEQSSAGFWAGVFGFMNLFARALGGVFADRVGRNYGMKGKGLLLAGVLLLEGLGLVLFAQSGSFGMAIFSMIFFALFLKMANGATYAITPFINEKNAGMVAGVVGAGGNVGGMLFGFLFKSESITYVEAFGYIGLIVIAVAVVVLFTRFTKTSEKAVEPKKELEPVFN